MAECSMSRVSQSKPMRASTRVAYKSPSESQVPKLAWPSRSLRFTGLVLMGRCRPGRILAEQPTVFHTPLRVARGGRRTRYNDGMRYVLYCLLVVNYLLIVYWMFAAQSIMGALT